MWCTNCQKEVVVTRTLCGDCGKEPVSDRVGHDLSIASHAVRSFREGHLRVDPGEVRGGVPDSWPEINSRRGEQHTSSASNWLPWSMICLGMMAFTFGAITAGWSLWGNRPDLWHVGFPTFLGGQAILLVGMVLQMNGLWSNQYQTTRTVSDLDSQFQHLRTATMSPGESASNKLVALKKQLDQLGD